MTTSKVEKSAEKQVENVMNMPIVDRGVMYEAHQVERVK